MNKPYITDYVFYMVDGPGVGGGLNFGLRRDVWCRAPKWGYKEVIFPQKSLSKELKTGKL